MNGHDFKESLWHFQDELATLWLINPVPGKSSWRLSRGARLMYLKLWCWHRADNPITRRGVNCQPSSQRDGRHKVVLAGWHANAVNANGLARSAVILLQPNASSTHPGSHKHWEGTQWHLTYQFPCCREAWGASTVVQESRRLFVYLTDSLSVWPRGALVYGLLAKSLTWRLGGVWKLQTTLAHEDDSHTL